MLRPRWLERMGLLLVLLNASAFSRADEAASIALLEKGKATVIRADGKSEGPVVAVVMWGPEYKVEQLNELKELKNLQKLRIGGPWITDEGVKELRNIKTLRFLEIRSPKITDVAFKELQEALPNLKVRRALPDETPFAAFAEKK